MKSPAARIGLLLVVLLLAGRLFPSTGLTNAADETRPPGLYLEKPLLYVLLSPPLEILDNLTFLSRSQHFVMAGSLAALTLAFLFLRYRRRWVRVLLGMCFFWTLYAWVLILCAFLPRPMAALRSADPDDLVVDFHSHTSASRDGLPWFDPEASRRWHTRAGFHAVYITDHDIVNATFRAKALNPARAGDGLVFLPGEELSLYKLHLVVIGNTDWIDPEPHCDSPEQTYALLRQLAARKNVLAIGSLPEYNDYSWASVPGFVAAGIHGFEMATGAPQSLDFPRERRSVVVDLARSRGLFLTAATDTHGYGCASLAWTVLHLPGWRSLPSGQLDKAIRERLVSGGIRGSVPVVRDTAYPADSWKTPGILPAFIWGIVRSLNWGEWVVWTAAIGIWLFYRRRKIR